MASNTFGKRISLRIILIVVLAAALRVVVLELDKLDCYSAPYIQWNRGFVCDMGFFVMPALMLAALHLAVIPFMIRAEKRERFALAAAIIIVPVFANALLRVAEFFLLICTEADFDDADSVCLEWAVQAGILAVPTLLAVLFLALRGWKLIVGAAPYRRSQMKYPVGLLVLALLMSACSPGATFPRLIPTPLPPDEDCSNYLERAVDLSQMDELFMSGTDTEILFDEDGAREHGFSEKSIALAREMAALSEEWLNTRPGDDAPVVTAHVQWFYDCATENQRNSE